MARRLHRLPGHREGIRRHQRYGQLTLAVAPTLDPKFSLGRKPKCVVCDDKGCEFCPKV